MSHRSHARNRPDPRDARLEQALRRALHMAADAIEPGADGLEKIEAKILASRYAHQLGSGGADLAGLSAWPAWAPWRRWLAAGAWVQVGASLARAAAAVAARLRPEPGRPGPWGWLRPAAAVATGLFVVVAASWAITALPQVISPSNDSTGINGASQGGPATPAPGASSSRASVGGTTGRGKSPSPSPTPTCPSASASPSTSPSGSPSATPSPSGTPSPSPSPSISPSPSASPPSPSPSPSSTPSTTTGPVSSVSPAPTPTQASNSLVRSVTQFIARPQATAGTRPAAASPSPTPSTRPSGSASPSPCRVPGRG